MVLYKRSGEEQRELLAALREHSTLWEALRRLSAHGAENWYLGAGCINQTVWNSLLGHPFDHGILDYDLVYYDPDTSERAEQSVRDHASKLLSDLGVVLDVKNQARVHLWYRQRFGYGIRTYSSLHDAVATWPTTAGAVAVRLNGSDLEICAPFGLNDIFDLTVRPNRVQITPAIYREKVRRWSACWPSLRVLPWEEGVGVEGSRVVKDPHR